MLQQEHMEYTKPQITYRKFYQMVDLEAIEPSQVN